MVIKAKHFKQGRWDSIATVVRLSLKKKKKPIMKTSRQKQRIPKKGFIHTSFNNSSYQPHMRLRHKVLLHL